MAVQLKKLYKEKIIPKMMEDFKYKSIMQVPRLEKIVVNMGLGEAKENIKVIDENLTAVLDYESSPYEFPTKAIGIERDRYPAVQPVKNISGSTKNPEIIWLAAMYIVKNHDDLSSDEITRLQSGALRSHPWDFGGEL